jgi:hypothetical protein
MFAAEVVRQARLSHNGSGGLTPSGPVATIIGNKEERVWPV